jgi:hypothetical protein
MPRDNAISKQMREMREFDEIGPRIRGEMRAWALTFLGRVPGPDEKVLDLLAEAADRAQQAESKECVQCGGDGRMSGICIDGSCADQDDPDCGDCSRICEICGGSGAVTR